MRDVVKRSMTSRRLKCMSRRGHSLINIERVLDLPFGTFNSIINRELYPLPEEVAIVRFIFSMPWLIDAYDSLPWLAANARSNPTYLKEIR